jgi:hypothetical protein
MDENVVEDHFAFDLMCLMIGPSWIGACISEGTLEVIVV